MPHHPAGASTDRLLNARFELAIQALILASVVAFSLETMPDLSPRCRRFLAHFETFTILVFSLEYWMRLRASPSPMSFATSLPGLIDLLAILPSILLVGLDLRSLRLLRFMRLFRILKLVRYNRAIRRIQLALHLAREELIVFMGAACVVLYLAAVGIYYFENPAQPTAFSSIFQCLWWAIVTLTTVGYGDIYPITTGGRLFTSVLLLVGLGLVAVPSGLLASALTRAREREDADRSGEHDRATAGRE